MLELRHSVGRIKLNTVSSVKRSSCSLDHLLVAFHRQAHHSIMGTLDPVFHMLLQFQPSVALAEAAILTPAQTYNHQVAIIREQHAVKNEFATGYAGRPALKRQW